MQNAGTRNARLSLCFRDRQGISIFGVQDGEVREFCELFVVSYLLKGFYFYLRTKVCCELIRLFCELIQLFCELIRLFCELI